MRLIDAGEIINRSHDVIIGNGTKHRCFDTTLIHEIPTVDAVPISFIEKRIEQLKSHADYEFESNGGYAGGSQYRQWELECLLDAWMKVNADG